MSFASRNRGGAGPIQHRTAIVVICGASLLLAIIVGALYYSSPYLATDAAVARFANKTLSTTTSDDELQAIASNLYAALDQIVPGGQGTQPESVLAQVGRAVVQEVRGQLLTEVSRRLASREGIDLALYGWQKISDRQVVIQRRYSEFPSLFSVVMVDALDSTTLSELVFLRSGFGDWGLIAVRPHWMRNQGTEILRQIVQAGVQKVTQPSQAPTRP